MDDGLKRMKKNNMVETGFFFLDISFAISTHEFYSCGLRPGSNIHL
jgi:hypothetical protein